MKNELTIFPSGIDSRIFFSDCDLENLPTMEKYKNLISSGKYTEAANCLYNADVDYYGAWFLNLLENRLRAIGRYALDEIEKPELVLYQSTEPSTTEGMCWVGDI